MQTETEPDWLHLSGFAGEADPDVQTTIFLDLLVVCRFLHRGLLMYSTPLPILRTVLLLVLTVYM